MNIPVYIIHLKHRLDRKTSISHEFGNKKEFIANLMEACENPIGALGLWYSIIAILENEVNAGSEFIILCEDDHQFTKAYSKELLFSSIEEAKSMDADILSGGISGFTSAIKVSNNLYWVEEFSGLQFTVVFKKFFQTILNADFGARDVADCKISSLSDNKFFIYPFISIQKYFGYSDVTPRNNEKGHVKELFKKSIEKVTLLKNICSHYKKVRATITDKIDPIDWNSITIPAYVINLPERTDRRKHIENQFRGRNEFDVRIVEACKHNVGAIGLWMSIRKIIETALENDDDVIIICEDDHEFTKHYNFYFLLSNIIQTFHLGGNILNGGIGGFNTAVSLTENIYWIDSFWCTQFIVVFKRFFQAILNEPFTETDTADGKFSEMTSQKMAIYPFISVQKDFGYSDVTCNENSINGSLKNPFEKNSNRLNTMQTIYKKYGSHPDNPTNTVL